MKLTVLIGIISLSISSFSCSSGNKNTPEQKDKDPYEGLTVVTEWGQGPGIEAYADYQYTMGSSFGKHTIHVYRNNDKGDIAFVTDEERKVIASLNINKSDLKPQQYISYIGAIENFDPDRKYWEDPYTVDPYYIVLFEVANEDDFIEKPYFNTVVKAWHFDEDKRQFTETPVDGLGIQNESYGI